MEDDGTLMKQLTWMTKDQPRLSEVLIDNSIHVGRVGSEFPIPRIFGYLDTRAAVSQRAVMDTSFAVSTLNDLYFLKPQKQCTNARADEKVMLCLFITNESLETCMESYCK